MYWQNGNSFCTEEQISGQEYLDSKLIIVRCFSMKQDQFILISICVTDGTHHMGTKGFDVLPAVGGEYSKILTQFTGISSSLFLPLPSSMEELCSQG